jgi:hypothetical protein
LSGASPDSCRATSTLSASEKAALWLYGWSFVDWRRQRREAAMHIDLLAESAEPAEPAPTHLRIAGGGT